MFVATAILLGCACVADVVIDGELVIDSYFEPTGCGQAIKAQDGDKVSLLFTASLPGDQVFYSSTDKPVQFVLGEVRSMPTLECRARVT